MIKLNDKTVKEILGLKKKVGGTLNVVIDNVPYNCTKSLPVQEQMANLLSGQKGGKRKKESKNTNKKSKKSKKSLYKEYLDKKYSKEELFKKCKKLGIKVTKRINGILKPIKKETLINKIVKIKFN